MHLLLDTHILLWCLQDSLRLSKKVRTQILAAPMVYVSSVSIWEISIKVGIGKLNLDLGELVNQMAQTGLQELRISHAHAAAVLRLPYLHKDPFDRMLVAQAVSESLRLLTADRLLASYSPLVEVI
ncbi:type II toxin-antitoxin system VapC family toxin [Duganella dendranthematis]|uniref:Type II toxin-antitoxin system VapC family toxin n=1 Tax=Duganella dendranthematis TaxID=2728021 RepID=A0ABX6M887_9BURK|nr:type II toxin-antitoxin system VapC family toxin [Duganella dendranthematis]QJD90524.1 type II toxin-antitoxin system VapC family toxin [Duganella dendranthematis]